MDPLRASRIFQVDSHDDGVNAWTMTRIAPPPRLTPLIDGYCIYDDRSGNFDTRRELPHAEGVMIVNFADPIFITGGDGREITLRAGEAFVAGAHLRPALSRSTGSQSGVHIFLPLASLRRLLGVPMTELVDRVTPLDGVAPSGFAALFRSLADGLPVDRQIALLDRALSARAASAPPLDRRQIHALRLLRTRPDLDIAAIADKIGWSRKHMADRLRDATGIGPRSFRRLLRFQRLTALLAATPSPKWADIACDAGYFDQSHLIREFREFAMMTPTEFIARSLGDGGGVVEGRGAFRPIGGARIGLGSTFTPFDWRTSCGSTPALSLVFATSTRPPRSTFYAAPSASNAMPCMLMRRTPRSSITRNSCWTAA